MALLSMDETFAPVRTAKDDAASRKRIVRSIAQWLFMPRRPPEIRDQHIRRDIGLDR